MDSIPFKINQRFNTTAFFASLGSFLLSFLLITMLHETGHLFVLHVYNIPTLAFYNHLVYNYKLLSSQQNISVALGGLGCSLGMWVAAGLLIPKKWVNNNIALLMFWLYVWATVSFWGYVFTAAFPVYGDLSYICMALEYSIFWRIVISILGITAFYFAIASALPFAQRILGTYNKPKTLFLLPVVLGSIIIVLLSIPTDNYFTLIYPAFSVFYIMPFYFDLKKEAIKNTGSHIFSGFASFSMCTLAILLFVLLRKGINFNIY